MAIIGRAVRALSSISPVQNRGPKLFKPQTRFAVLVNGYDRPERFAGNKDGYYHLDHNARGNKSLHEFESAIRRGELNIVPEIMAHLTKIGEKEAALAALAVDQRVAKIVKTNGYWGSGDIIEKEFPKGHPLRLAAYLSYDNRLAACSDYYEVSSKIKYDRVFKVFPDQDIKAELLRSLALLGDIANSNSLTLLFFVTHGSTSEVADTPYTELIAAMNAVPGKKVVISPSCYSGSLIERLRGRKEANDIAVIAATSAFQEGLNWNSDQFITDICRLIRGGKRMSRYSAKEYFWDKRLHQIPSVHLPFDVIL